jgi:tight adherence protein B
MGAVVGLMLGLGLLLIWQSLQTRRSTQRRRPLQRIRARLSELIAEAGFESVTAPQVLGACIGCGIIAALVSFAVSQTFTVAGFFSLGAAYAPLALVRYRARQRRQELRELWPDAVDNLASAVRAGMSLPEALTQLGQRGPETLRRPFIRFGEEYRATGRFYDCLDRLKTRLADPTGDRIVESLRIAREVGGSDLGRLLRTLSGFLREDARTRAELESRQTFIVNAARLAVAAPWLLLGMLSVRTSAIKEYDSPAGLIVLAIGAAVCVVAYRLMLRLGRLPEERRVLR